MNYSEVFQLYDVHEPLRYEIKKSNHGDNDYRVSIFAQWPDRKLVIKLADNDFTNAERIEGWVKTIEEYLLSGYYCPRIIKNRNDQYSETVLLKDRVCLVYAEEFSKYKTAEAFSKSEITRNNFYIFLDDVIRSIGIIGAKHLKTVDFPSGYSILEKFAPSDLCDEVMQESLRFKKVMDESLPQYKNTFQKIWNLFMANKKKLEEVYHLLPTSVFQADLNYTNILLDDKKSFVGMLDFNLCGRDTVVNYLFREIMMEYDCYGNIIFYSQEANDKNTRLFLSKIRLVADIYSFSELEKNTAILVYRYLKPFWWRPAHEIEKIKDNEQKVAQILKWVENELTRTDIDFSEFMEKKS